MMENSSTLIGKMLGNCKIERLIGRGGHAAVFLATQESLQRAVAVKVLLPQVEIYSHLHANFLARFQREASVIARLNHVNILHIYDYGEQDGLAFLIMPYYSGGTLKDLLKQQGKFSPQQTLIYVEQIASALDYAHRQGVIHRDLKPANFLLANDGRLVLADFGIAHMMESTDAASLTGTGLILGTPEYMAPEMIQAHPIDLRTDIYELGIVLFQMLSGKTPYQSTTAYATMLMHLTEPVPSLLAIEPELPGAMDTVIHKATALDPQQRFSSAGELAQALRLAINTGHSEVQSDLAADKLRYHRIDPALQQIHPSTVQPLSNNTPALPNKIATSVTPTPLPPTSSRKAQTKRRSISMPMILSILVILSISITGTILFIRSESPPPPPGTQLTPEQVQIENTLQQYYDKINRRNYQGAYAMWLNTAQVPHTCKQDPGFLQFANGFSTTEHDQIAFDRPPRLDSQGQYSAFLLLHATEITAEGTRESVYHEQYHLIQVNGIWKIKDGGHTTNPNIGAVTPVTIPGATPSEQAQALVQQYYNAINQHDYPVAYSIRGVSFQALEPYCQMAEGYSHTTRNDLAFTGLTEQADGTVTIQLTLTATEDSGTGAVQHTFAWNGTVGKENNALKILQARASLIA